MSKTQSELVIIGHRGASGVEPENTLRAFELAIQLGAQMIEMDLHATRDGQVVVIHDDDLSNRTNLKGRVSEMSLHELARADAGKGEKIPTLQETLELTKGRVRLYLEIKARAAARRTIEMVRDYGCRDEVLLASFDLKMMKEIGQEVTDMEVGLILGKWSPYRWLRPNGFRYDVLSMEVGGCSERLVAREHSMGKKVYAWTANASEVYARLCQVGVDGICTDYPERLVSFVSETR